MNYSVWINRKTFFRQLIFPLGRAPLSRFPFSQPAHAFGYRRREWRSTVVCGSSPLPPTIVTLLGSLLLPLSTDSIVDMELLTGERDWLAYHRFHSFFFFYHFIYYFLPFSNLILSYLSSLCTASSLTGHSEKALCLIKSMTKRRKELKAFCFLSTSCYFCLFDLIFWLFQRNFCIGYMIQSAILRMEGKGEPKIKNTNGGEK